MRENAQQTAAEVVALLGWSESKISRIETGHIGIRTSDLDRLLSIYGVPSRTRSRLRGLAAQSRQRAWWEAYGDSLPNAYETYIGLEAEASRISTYEAQIVHGLLQTDEYANAVIAADGVFDDPGVLDQRVAVRMARQAVLARHPAPEFAVVLDEAVIHRQIGGPDVLRRQLGRLIELGERPNVTIQILPFAAGAHRGLAGSFVLLDFPGETEDPIVYSEGLTGGVFRSKPDDLRSYREGFEALHTASLTPEQSMELLTTVTRDET
jgi:transcriptional regulator with XRE-family HTH domain